MTVPNGWNKLLLEDCFWFQEGPGVRKWQFTNSGTKLLNVANIEKSGNINLGKTDRYLSNEEVQKKYSHFLLDDGDLVIASSGISFDEDGMLRTRGAFIQEQHLPLCLNTSTIRFKSKKDVSDTKYLKHWLDSREFREQITKLVTGSAQQNFGPSHLKATKITLPPLTEQRRIAAILDQADALRAKRRETLAQLDSLTQSIFIDMFGDPETNPNRLPVINLEELCVRITDGTHQSPKWESDGIPFLFISNIVNGEISYNTDKFISRETYKELTKRCPIESGDILFTTVGSYGNTAVVSGDREFCFQRHIAHIKPNVTKLDSSFCAVMLESSGVRRQIDKAARGVAQKTVNLADLKALHVFAPPLETQKSFTEKLEVMKSMKNIQAQSLREIDALFASVQHSAFRGEL